MGNTRSVSDASDSSSTRPIRSPGSFPGAPVIFGSSARITSWRSTSAVVSGGAARWLLAKRDMPNQDYSWPPVEPPAEMGPDYVALVIEWEDDIGDQEVTKVTERPALASGLLLPGSLRAACSTPWASFSMRSMPA